MTDFNLQDLCTITSYFNPAGFRTRLDNYHTFRQNLNAPLLTVELSFNGNFELTKNDADILVQIHAEDIMWQKERLLNIALQELPDQYKLVMWVDCDVVFEREDWLDSTVGALRENVLIQPYSMVYDLKQGINVSATLQGNVLIQRESMAWKICNGSIDFESTSANMLEHYSPGHAWAVHRDAVEQSGLYDAMIIGSGDFAISMAAVEHYDDIVSSFKMNSFQTRHYLAWSKKWSRSIKGRIGVVKGGLRHLWHGDLDDRGYDSRYASFPQFTFDPYTDIDVSANGCWCWSSDKPELHEYIRKYFESRKEDGHQE